MWGWWVYIYLDLLIGTKDTNIVNARYTYIMCVMYVYRIYIISLSGTV